MVVILLTRGDVSLNFKNITILGFTLLLSLVLVACGNNEEAENTEDTNQEQENNEVIATVNDEKITKDELDAQLEQTKQMYAQQGIDLEADEYKEMKEQLITSVIDQLVNTTLLTQASKDINVSEEEVAETMNEITGQFESEEELNAALEANNFTLEELEKEITKEIRMNKYVEANTEEVQITEEQKQAAYDEFSAQNEEIPPYEEIEGQIEQQLLTEKEKEQVQKLVQELRENAEVEILI